MRVILAGGGTGGHVIPAIAIAQELRSRYGAEVLFIGTARGLENRLVPAAGFPLQLVKVGALNRVSLATRLKTAFDLPRAVFAARRMLIDLSTFSRTWSSASADTRRGQPCSRPFSGTFRHWHSSQTLFPGSLTEW